MKTLWLAACLLLGVTCASAQFTGVENFSANAKDTSKWGADIATGSGQLTQSGDGLLRFTCAGNTDDDSMAWPWTKGRAPYASDWSIQIDVHVPFIALAEGFAATGIGLGVRHAADSSDLFGLFLENERSPGEAQEFNFFNDLEINGSTTETAATATNPNAALRISWNAATQTLTAAYDADGNVNGYAWTTLQTFQPATGGWGMSAAGEFEIFVAGFAESTEVTAQQNLYADDFLVTDASGGGGGSLAGFDDFNDNSKDPAKWGPDDGDPDNSMTEVSQRLEYTKLSAADGYACRPWILNNGSYTEDWEAMVDVHLPNLNLTADGHDARLYLDVTSGGASAAMQLDLTRLGGATQRRFRWESEGPGGGEMTAATTSTDASLRIAFDAGSKTLSFFHDSNGSSGGYTWTALGSLDVDAAGTDWGLTAGSRFDISICGESEGTAIPIAQVYADNFRAFSHPAPAVSGFTGRDDFSATSRTTTKWGTPVPFGPGLLTQSGDGVVRFSSSPGGGVGENDDKIMVWPWIGDAPFATSWSIQADVHMPHFALSPGHSATGMGIGVCQSADTDDAFFMHLENVRSNGPQMFNFFNSVEIDDDNTEHATPATSRLGAVRVSWNATTKLLRAEYDPDGPVGGYNWQLLNSFNPVTGGWNMAASSKFKILLSGYSEVDSVPLTANIYADNFYTFGMPVVTTLPVVKTLAAAPVSHDSATLNGLVNAKGSERNITFDYGTTSSLGSSIAATPGTADGSADTPVTAVLTGLMPHTKYHFRARAAGTFGAANGATMTFTTSNRAPVAQADPFTVTKSAVVTLPVLDNDDDPDGDVLSLGTYSALTPTNAGKLAKAGNTLVFTAAAGFTGATFTYSAKDALGLASAPVMVTLTAGDCMISPMLANPSSEPITYPISITSDGAWSVTETLPWVTVSPVSGSGDGVVQVSVLPHTSLQPRSGSLFIGGEKHDITQDKNYQPVLSDPPDIPPAIVSGQYELVIPTENLPVTYTVTNLPPGLKLDGGLGLLSGRPTKAGSYDMTIKARNAAGSAVATLSFTIEVEGLRPGLVGTFHGLAGRQEDLNQNLGSRLELTIVSTGAISGRCITGVTPLPFSGVLDSLVNDPDHPTATLVIPRPKLTPMTLQISFDQVGGTFAGNLSAPATPAASAEGWRNPWHVKNRVPAYYRKLHNLVLEQTNPDPSLPQGYGYASFATVTEATGAITVTGKLADGNTITSASFLGKSGEILLYVPLYSNRGSLAGKLTLTPHDAAIPDNAITGSPTWFKSDPLPTSTDTLYKAGFGPIPLVAEGDTCPQPPPGGLLFGLTSADPEAELVFSRGGLETEGREFTQEMTLLNTSATGMNNIITLVQPVQYSLNPPTVTTATGAFGGLFILPGTPPPKIRRVAFQGLLVSRPAGVMGYGYFLLPETTASTSTRRSGAVLFRAEPP